MYAHTAREWVRQFGRDAAGTLTSVTDAQLDRAIMALGQRFVRETGCTPLVSDLTLVTSDPDLPTLPTGFRPEYIVNAYLDDSAGDIDYPDDLRLVTFANLRRLREDDNSEGQPRYIAFSSATAGQIYPTPSSAFTLKLRWNQPFTTWTDGQAFVTATIAGGAVTGITVHDGGSIYSSAPTVTFSSGAASATAAVSGGAVTTFTIVGGGSGYTTAPTVLLNGVSCPATTLNVEDAYLQSEFLMFGVPALLQHADPEKGYSTDSWQKYLAFEANIRGRVGGLGARLMLRNRGE